MIRRKKVIIVVTVISLVAITTMIAIFVPLFPVTATDPNFNPWVTTTTVNGNQTGTISIFNTPGPIPSSGSLTYCFWGEGALLQNGKYYSFTVSRVLNENSFCPTG